MFRRKSVVLSDTEGGSNQKAVMTLEEDSAGVRGTLRLYNFSHELSGVSSLGLYSNQKVHKAGLTAKSHMLYEFFIDLKGIPENFSCAVINFQNAVARPILYGSSDGNDENVYGSIISEISKDSSVQNTENVLNKFDVNFDEKEKEQIEKEIDDAVCGTNCESCIYKKYFFEHENNSEKELEIVAEVAGTEILNENVEEKEEDVSLDFFEKLKPQIDKLFEKNPVEEHLQELIPSSKWIKVEYEDDGDFYVFGLLYDEDENVKYVCYGVPAVFEENPPKELSGFPIWLPLDKQNKDGFGYWLTYQDAGTGEPVRAILD